MTYLAMIWERIDTDPLAFMGVIAIIALAVAALHAIIHSKD